MPFHDRMVAIRIAVLFCLCLAGCDSPKTTGPTSSARVQKPPAATPVSTAEVATFCGNCHATPPASSFPREAWPEEVSQGYKFFFASQRTDLQPPPQQRVVEYYQQRAPEKLVYAIPPRTPSNAVSFERVTVPRPGGGRDPGVSFITVLNGGDDASPRVLFCDMARGGVHELISEGTQATARQIADVPNPCHVAVCDLDGDQKGELVVADLGSFRPSDHNYGRVLWVPQGVNADSAPVMVLDSDMGRVADVRPGDFDRDGDQDLVVAEFGWRDTGKISILENRGMMDGRPQMQRHVIDQRHGAIHTIPTDLNGDGRLDFVALLAQEYESVEVFLATDQPLSFERKVIHTAGDPAFGSSGIELVDLDGDQDLDVVFTNGDAFDSGMPKPYHGIQWLENQGSYPFTYHHLTAMPGVHRAVPGDLDGDGDLDLVCTAHLPGNPAPRFPQVRFDSVLWLEQVSTGQFVPHSLEENRCYHAACTVSDLDRDGDMDIVVGEFPISGSAQSWLTVWWNRGKEKAVTGSE